jgi:catechol 2,3-dioxygenase-like lactoylglutathione lyase family enzyme
MTSQPRFGFALEYVADIASARRFYVEVLGLVAQREAPTFVQFETFAIASDESLSGTRELELYWLVDDAEAAFRELSQKGEISVPLRDMPFGKVFGLTGPTGQPRFVLELSQNRPSRPI